VKVIQAKRKDLGNRIETNTKKNGVIADKETEDVDPPCTNDRKRKMSDKEDSDAWTVRVKKGRVSDQMLIISLSYRVRKEGHPHQTSRWGAAVKGEDIRRY
jgi:hypothetical protein